VKVLHVHTDLVGGGIERMMGTLAMHTHADEVGICWCPANHAEPFARDLHALEEAGVALHRIPPPFLSLRYAARLADALRRLRPDVLHLHGASVGVIGSFIGRTLRVPAIVYTEHLQHDRHAGWLQRAREMTCGIPNRTVYVSQRSFRLAVEEGPMAGIADRACVIHNGIDLSPFEAETDPGERAEVREQLELSEQTVAIGCVGLLWEAKGQEYLIRAMAEVERGDGELTLLLIGGGADEAHLRKLADDLSVGESTRFLGWRHDVPRVLRALDLYVQPSLTEGLPLAVVEAAAAGLPIVATDAGGIPEIITDGRDGLLVPSADPQALAGAMQTLLDDRSQALEFGEAAKHTAFERFSAEAMAERYMELYETLL